MKTIFIPADSNTVSFTETFDRNSTLAQWDDEQKSLERLKLQIGHGIDNGEETEIKNHHEMNDSHGISVLTIQKSDDYDTILFYVHGVTNKSVFAFKGIELDEMIKTVALTCK